MASSKGGRSLEETPTWAVAVVCFVLVLISIIIEHIIHLIGQWLTKRHKRALFEALEKIKAELMLLGFISLMLTVGQGPISGICIPESVGATWHPCSPKQEKTKYGEDEYKDPEDGGRRRLLSMSAQPSDRRVLAAAAYDKCSQGKVPFVSVYGIHQLHIFIFVLAVSHVLYCIVTLALGRAKMSKWKAWEMETRTIDYQSSHDPERFRFARDTTFGRRHLSFWSHSSVLLWIVCFFRQFVRSVPKVDYLTLRHGFIMAHLAPQSHTEFDFQQYIKRSLEEDFKVVVGISPTIWFFALVFLLFNTHGSYSHLWLPFLPLIIILVVGMKLQVIITKMGLRIQERGEVVKGTPVVQPGDDLFWFNRPRLILYLIHFVLFQNAFQLAFFAWSSYEFGLRSCFHKESADITIRISMGVLIQILCSYVTLPLYALVTQMGSNMKPTIFNDRVANALRNWHQTAKKQVKQNRGGAVTPISSRPGTPSHTMSPVHLLRHYKPEADSVQASPRMSSFEDEGWHTNEQNSPRQQYGDAVRVDYSAGGATIELSSAHDPSLQQTAQPTPSRHEIDIYSAEFSFEKFPKS
ncbi:MLO-like protein 12 [Punica granatum]|uniref:MLO-like protein n=1 Tax=Punica granatum TaxID=22663 RepID=A0A6P8DTE7_PUNGR|nr:MLO-like protein 12 [Punica granatum]